MQPGMCNASTAAEVSCLFHSCPSAIVRGIHTDCQISAVIVQAVSQEGSANAVLSLDSSFWPKSTCTVVLHAVLTTEMTKRSCE
jgi:hypothetical protein